MPVIKLETLIAAKREICFDISLDMDLHPLFFPETKERAVAGKTTGLIGPGEWVTFEATHLGVRQRLTSHITEYQRPGWFVDEMARGIFKEFRHEHTFISGPVPGQTTMVDRFFYRSPLGWLGRMADRLFLEKYLRTLLERRNQFLKTLAEQKAGNLGAELPMVSRGN